MYVSFFFIIIIYIIIILFGRLSGFGPKIIVLFRVRASGGGPATGIG